ncbi:LysR family transcriptional regulator [Oryzifoliimicrobium ureilyticus]|uniref:LysR family transcriptional regulator n=1 Tax=Oryzifoliimicrobium ureilyticus TaxID=3113724 RepID=UPI00307632D9
MSYLLKPPLPLLDNDILKTFLAIADTGSFSTAAEVVHRTPSAVSMQIKRLEEQLKTTLFLRDARSVSLTKDGEVLLSYARNMLALSNEAVSRFLEPELTGVVRLGAPDDIGERMLPHILRRFADHYPAIVVDVTVDMSTNLKRRLEEQRLDLALVNCTPNVFAHEGELLREERLVWAGAKGGKAYKTDPLPISIWEEGCCWRKDALLRLEQGKREYRIAYLSAHTMAQRAAVMSDLAVAPFPLSYLGDDMTVLGAKEGLPELASFHVRLLTADRMSEPMRAVAESIRLAFSKGLHVAAA